MKRSKFRDFLIVVLIIIILICLCVLGHRFYQYYQGTSIYNEAESLVNLPDFSDMQAGNEFASEHRLEDSDSSKTNVESPTSDETPSETHLYDASGSSETAAAPNPYTEALRNMDFAKLREVNPDVLGWIVMPNTSISYPMVQAADNDFYLYRTWNLSNSIVGSIFLDANCAPDFHDFNTLIYGHNMNNGSMFGALRKFRTADYWNSHSSFMIKTDEGVYTYKIFSAFEAELTDPVFMVRINREDEKQALIDCAVSKSTIAIGIVPNVEDKIVTLSTCTGRGHSTRWIVLGVLDSFEPTDTESTLPV